MKHNLFRYLLLAVLMLSTLSAGAKKYQFQISPMGKTKALTEADSLAFLACPIFHNATLKCYPQDTRGLEADFNSEKEVEKALKDMVPYFEEHPLEGEYSIMAGDKAAGKLIGCSVNIRHHSAKHDAAVNEAHSWLKALIFAILAVGLAFASLKLFTTKKAAALSRIGGTATALLAAIFGILALLAIFALAFKYICIVLGCIIALVALLSVLGGFSSSQKQKADTRAAQKGWVVNGQVYLSKDSAEEAARNTGSNIYFKG